MRKAHGRAWPLLTGERGHYEVAAGNKDAAVRMLAAMNGFASQAGLLSEQVWDSDDLPDRALYRGRPTGSAMPLAWTHSEYIRLLRSIRDGRVFDMPRDAAGAMREIASAVRWRCWRFDHQVVSFPAGRKLRLELLAPAIVHFSTDRWATTLDFPTHHSGVGVYTIDLPTADMDQGEQLCFTFRWPEAGNRWEGKDFTLAVDAPREEPVPARRRRKTGDTSRTPAETHQ